MKSVQGLNIFVGNPSEALHRRPGVSKKSARTVTKLLKENIWNVNFFCRGGRETCGTTDSISSICRNRGVLFFWCVRLYELGFSVPLAVRISAGRVKVRASDSSVWEIQRLAGRSKIISLQEKVHCSTTQIVKWKWSLLTTNIYWSMSDLNTLSWLTGYRTIIFES